MRSERDRQSNCQQLSCVVPAKAATHTALRHRLKRAGRHQTCAGGCGSLLSQGRLATAQSSSAAILSKNEERRLSESAYHSPGPLLAANVAAQSSSVQSRRCIDRSKRLEKNSSDHSHQVPSFLTPRSRSYRSISAGAISEVTDPNTRPVLTTRFNSRTARVTCLSATWHRLVSNTKSNSPSLNGISTIDPSLLNFFSAFGVLAWIARLFSMPHASIPRVRSAATSSPLADPATSSL